MIIQKQPPLPFLIRSANYPDKLINCASIMTRPHMGNKENYWLSVSNRCLFESAYSNCWEGQTTWIPSTFFWALSDRNSHGLLYQRWGESLVEAIAYVSAVRKQCTQTSSSFPAGSVSIGSSPSLGFRSSTREALDTLKTPWTFTLTFTLTFELSPFAWGTTFWMMNWPDEFTSGVLEDTQ